MKNYRTFSAHFFLSFLALQKSDTQASGTPGAILVTVPNWHHHNGGPHLSKGLELQTAPQDDALQYLNAKPSNALIVKTRLESNSSQIASKNG